MELVGQFSTTVSGRQSYEIADADWMMVLPLVRIAVEQFGFTSRLPVHGFYELYVTCVRDAAEILGITALLKRRPAALSGGQEKSPSLQAAPPLPLAAGMRPPGEDAAKDAAPAETALPGPRQVVSPAAEQAPPRSAPEAAAERRGPAAEAVPPSPRPFVLQEFTLLFDPNSVELTPRARDTVALAAGLLRASPETAALVEGHSDGAGDPAYNLFLSGKRAMAVKTQLIAQGLDPERVRITAFGAERPVDTNETPEGRNKNRRVVIRIVSRTGS